jgi:phosphate transport system substrate-binding protein
MRRWLLAGVTIGLCGGATGCGEGEPRLNSGGASFVYPVMLKWTRVYDRQYGVQVDYQSTGSGNGVQQMIARTIDFGCTDAFLNKAQLEQARAAGGEVVHIPLAMGGVVPAYNVPGLPPGTHLHFTGPVLADIFLGEVTMWDDPALQALNPGVPLPAQRIMVVYRSDPSGTTAIFADYLAKVRPDLWKAKNMGSGTLPGFREGVGQKGNEGVAGLVRRLPGSLGYVELIYAEQNHLEYGTVRNKAGNDVLASTAAVTAAAENLEKLPDDLCYSLTDPPGKDSYPISGTNWAVFYVEQPPDRGPLIVGFLRWATHEGQEYAKALGYAPLPARTVKRIDEKLKMVEDRLSAKGGG